MNNGGKLMSDIGQTNRGMSGTEDAGLSRQGKGIPFAAERPGVTRRSSGLRLLWGSRTGTLGAVLLALLLAVSLLAPWIAPHPPAATNLSSRLLPPIWLEGGSASYLLGTDNLGRDIWSRIIYGSRISFIVGFGAVLVSGAIGLLLGLLAGFYGKWVDALIMRIVDALLAIPTILFMLLLLFIVGSGIWMLIVAIGLTNWAGFARIVRSETLSVKERDYVLAARGGGARDTRLLFRYVLPGVLPSFIVASTLNVGTAILLESSLSFLGLGIQPPQMSWGSMLSDGRQYLATHWWVATFPGIAITVAVLAVIFIGDWLRDRLDPRLK